MIRTALIIALALVASAALAGPTAADAKRHQECSQQLDDVGCYVYSAQNHRKAALGIALAQQYAPPRSGGEAALPSKMTATARDDMSRRYDALSSRLSGNTEQLAALKDAAAFWSISMEFTKQQPGESWQEYSKRQAGIDKQLEARLSRLRAAR